MPSDQRFAAYEAIQRFLSQAKRPVAIEAGEEPMAVRTGCYEVRLDGSRLLFEMWNSERNLVRRVTDVESETKSQLNLRIERFGKKTGVLQILDGGKVMGALKEKRAGRTAFREPFRRFLLRQFPGWKVAELSCEADLEHSLSPAHPRALLRQGTTGWAAIGAATSADSDFALTFGLIWLDYLRRRDARIVIAGLAIFVPEGHEAATCHRLRWLDPAKAAYRAFVHSDGWEQEVDVKDAGNIATHLPDRSALASVPTWVRDLGQAEGSESIDCGGQLSLRVRGLEYARWNGRELRAGMQTKRAVHEGNRSEVEALARELARARSEAVADARSPLYSVAPERWLESQIRENLTAIDAGLLADPVYGQAPTFAAGERGVIDLLGIGCDGRLTVVEIKASEDIHLPVQALDYWARVKWHLDRGEFGQKGYFPQLPVSRRAPRMLLVAPALHFHPTTETILRYLSSEVEVERIGLAASWRSQIRVMFRAAGDRLPGCDDKDEVRHEQGSASSGTSQGCTGSPESFSGTRGSAASLHDSAFCGDS